MGNLIDLYKHSKISILEEIEDKEFEIEELKKELKEIEIKIEFLEYPYLSKIKYKKGNQS